MNRTLHPVKNTLLTATMLGLTACTQETPLTLITIADTRDNPAQFTDNGDTGDSVGDVLTFDQPMLDENMKEIGNNSGVCIRTHVGHSFQCQWTLTFKNGTVQVAGREFDLGTSSIIGGTVQALSAKWNLAIIMMVPLRKHYVTGLDKL